MTLDDLLLILTEAMKIVPLIVDLFYEHKPSQSRLFRRGKIQIENSMHLKLFLKIHDQFVAMLHSTVSIQCWLT